MKNTSKKTVAAFALTLTLLLGLLPSAAFAADDEEISETTEITETVVNEAPAESTATAETAPSTETVVVEIPAEVPAETNAAAPQAPEAPEAPTAPEEKTEEPAEAADALVPLVVFHGTEEIAEEIVPQAAPQAGWALVNLLALILTSVTAVGMALTVRRKDENGEDRMSKLFGLLPAAGALVLFLLTENLSNPMVITDRWTVAMVAILAAELVLAYLTRRANSAEEN